MYQSRDVFRFNDALEEIQKLLAERKEAKDREPLEVPKNEAEIMDKFFAGEVEYNELSQEAQMYCALKSAEDQRNDPFLYSDLTDLLDLETWKPEVGLLVLAGIDPMAAIFEWSYKNFMGAEIDTPQIRHANCFSEIGDIWTSPAYVDINQLPV